MRLILVRGRSVCLTAPNPGLPQVLRAIVPAGHVDQLQTIVESTEYALENYADRIVT